jgi:puromycin-sensitive aminopeptidase
VIHFTLLTIRLLDAQVEINQASEVNEIFDAISYNKGASLIRMLQGYLGADRFQV